MNIIIVFTSPNFDECTERWGCINDIQSTCEKEWSNGECKLFIFNGRNHECDTYYGNAGWKLDTLAETINKIVETNRNAEIVVLFHSNSNEDANVKWLQESLGSALMPIHQYSRGKAFALDIWKNHIVKFCFEDTRTIEEKFISLWNDLQKSKESALHNLRYEILSPLVALDLINQAEENSSRDESSDFSTLKKEIKTSIDNLDGPIKEFCKLPIKCDEFNDQLVKLRKYDETPSWSEYQKKLKEVAEGMEEQIAAIEP